MDKIDSAAVLAATVFKVYIFNTFESILTLVSSYSHSNIAYIGYLSAFFIADIILFIFYRPRLNKAIWIIYIGAFLWGLVGFSQILILGFDVSAFYFFVFCYDVILWCGVVVSEKKIDVFWNYYSSCIYILSITSLAIVFITLVKAGSLSSIGTGSYQSYSYLCAYCFGMVGFSYRFNPQFRNTHKYAWVLLPFLFLATILPGGRGAFILLLLYLGFFIIYNLKHKMRRNYKFTLVQFLLGFMFLVLCIFLLIYYYDVYKNFLKSGFERAVEFIDFSSFSIDMSGTSGRGLVYENALKIIRENPLFGIGIYGYNYDAVWPQYPHNIILEILMQYGIILGAAVIVVLGYIEFSIMFSKNYMMKGLSLFPVVNLMFSDSYTDNVLFWFVVMWFCFSKIVKSKHDVFDVKSDSLVR